MDLATPFPSSTAEPARPREAPPKVLVVVVNYRTADLTIDCLRSLAAELSDWPGSRVVVTDNDSGDDSASRIAEVIRAEGWADWAEFRPLERNGGFAYGNNAAIRPALEGAGGPDFVWLLNPDTVVRPGALDALVRFLEREPGVGLVGSRLEDPDGTPQRSAFRFPTVLGELEGGLQLGLASRLLSRWVVAPPASDVACPTDWVAGASLLVRREVFEAVGLLDESFFMYFEEVDFCRRAADAGWPCWYEPASRVVHLVGQSSGVTDPRRPKKRRPRYWFDSRRRYFLAHHGRMGTVLADLVWTAGFASYRVRQRLQRKPDNSPERLLGDFVLYNFGPGLNQR